MSTSDSRAPGEQEPSSSTASSAEAPAYNADLTDHNPSFTTEETAATAGQEQSESLTDGSLVPQEAVLDYRSRWEAIQQGFVDDPRSAVGDADRLVGDVLQRLSETFEEQHQSLESQWGDGEPDTEELRLALQRYRAFFDRLLSL